MITERQHKTQVVRFRQWSRKGYAVFSSLGKQIVISHVGKGITEASLCKVEKYARHIEQYFRPLSLKEEELAESSPNPTEWEITILSSLAANTVNYSEYYYTLGYPNTKSYRGLSSYGDGSRFFIDKVEL